jgi:erythronate-4-phosphate dehydrogenase
MQEFLSFARNYPEKAGLPPLDARVGINTGEMLVGNIGSKVAAAGNILGMKVIKNDPPLKRKTGSNEYRDLNEIYDADIISLHVPLNKTGTDKTVHLFDSNNLNFLQNNAILINTSRGEVVNNKALYDKLNKSKLNTVLDVWENEPCINLELLNLVNIASPHIAGYSLEGKVNGTIIIYEELCKFLNKEMKWNPDLPIIEDNLIEIRENLPVEQTLFKILQHIYPINNDDKAIRKIKDMDELQRGKYFDELRKNYNLRRELKNYSVKLFNPKPEIEKILIALGLQIK